LGVAADPFRILLFFFFQAKARTFVFDIPLHLTLKTHLDVPGRLDHLADAIFYLPIKVRIFPT
jgi:hypothetical protein